LWWISGFFTSSLFVLEIAATFSYPECSIQITAFANITRTGDVLNMTTNFDPKNPALGGIRLVLGGNVFGWTADRDTSFAILDAFFDGGGRMVDTADVYSAWVPGHKGGESETVLGHWMAARGTRAAMRIAT